MSATHPGSAAFEVDRRSWVTIVRLLEPIWRDSQHLQVFQEQVLGLVEEQGQRPLLLDFAPVYLVSSAFLSRLIVLQRRLRAQGSQLVLSSLSPALQEVLERLQLSRYFCILADEREALAYLDAAVP
jgi:anti-anti-sigma factor